MAYSERSIDADRVTVALRRFVFAPGEERTEVVGDAWAPVIYTDQGRYQVFGTNWLIRDDPAIDDAVLVVTEPGVHCTVCYGILLAHDGTAYFLNDPATLRELGRYLGRGLDPIAFAQVLAAMYSYPSAEDTVAYPPDIGDLITDPEPAVRRDGTTTVIEFRSSVRRVVEYEDVVVDTVAWRVEAQAGEPARWERRSSRRVEERVEARIPTRVVMYSYASGSPALAAEFRWSATDGVTLTVFDRQGGALAERYMAEGIGSDALRRPVLPRESATFMRTLVQPARSTYVRLVDESDPDATEPDGDPPLPARTNAEALLYLDLHPCEGCGRVKLPWRSGPVFVNGIVARAYAGTCPGCGRERRFVFEYPGPGSPEPTSAEREASASGAAELIRFGGPQPSRLVDAGEWLRVADLTASRVPVGDPAGARYALSVAVAAMDEILKFIPPGAERAPAEAFWSVRGRQVWIVDPGRFEAKRLRIVRDVYAERLAALAGESALHSEEGRLAARAEPSTFTHDRIGAKADDAADWAHRLRADAGTDPGDGFEDAGPDVPVEDAVDESADLALAHIWLRDELLAVAGAVFPDGTPLVTRDEGRIAVERAGTAVEDCVADVAVSVPAPGDGRDPMPGAGIDAAPGRRWPGAATLNGTAGVLRDRGWSVEEPRQERGHWAIAARWEGHSLYATMRDDEGILRLTGETAPFRLPSRYWR